MSWLTSYLRKQLSAKLSLWIVSLVAVLFMVALFVMFHYARQAIKEEAMQKADETLERTIQNIDNLLHKAEVATINMHWNAEHHLDNKAALEDYCHQMLVSNPDIQGCAISLDPDFNKPAGQLFMAYSYRNEGDSAIYRSDHYGDTPYTEQNWYQVPLERNRACWLKPTTKDDDGDWSIVTYSIPLHNTEGQAVGVLAIDISLSWLSDTIFMTKPYPHAYCSVLDGDGNYIVHPDVEKLYHKTVYNQLEEEPDEEVSRLVESMLAGESGYRAVTLYGHESYVFFKPFKNERWSACIVCWESEIFVNYNRLLSWMAVISVCGLLALLLFCQAIIHKRLKPLIKLEHTVRRIAKGQFDTPIAQSRQQDEIGDLQNSFHAMQQSLEKHLAEVRAQADVLRERNEALNAAYQQAKEADRVKAVFLNNMTDQMVGPINAIATLVDDIETKQQQLKREDIEEMLSSIEKHTQTVTSLLDQLLTISTIKKSS